VSAMDTILVVNAGSSSVKFQAFALDSDGRLRREIKGQMDGIGSRPRLRASGATGDKLADRAYPLESVPDVPAALMVASAWLRDELQLTPLAVGHRVVHGGPDFDRAVLIDHGVVARLERFTMLAPLHQPTIWRRSAHCLRIFLRCLRSLASTRPFTAVMTRWPITMPYPSGCTMRESGAMDFTVFPMNTSRRRCHRSRLKSRMARVVVAHLGSGASMCAMHGGRSVESTMGFTALDGLPMGTRTGQIDPGVLLYLMTVKGMSPAEVQDFLYRDCGLKGLSGVSNDMRELQQSDDPRAAFAVDYFVYRVALHAGMLAGALQGLDAFIFTAGIGENSAAIRARIAKRLEWLGVSLDTTENARHARRISRPDSRTPVYIVPTDEELMIAQHTVSLLWNRQSSQKRERAS
jgi:acetate kinase